MHHHREQHSRTVQQKQVCRLCPRGCFDHDGSFAGSIARVGRRTINTMDKRLFNIGPCRSWFDLSAANASQARTTHALRTTSGHWSAVQRDEHRKTTASKQRFKFDAAHGKETKTKYE